MNRTVKFSLGIFLAFGVLAVGPRAEAQEKSDISVTRQPGIGYMATHIIEKRQLIEKHAARLGVPNLKVSWKTFSGGGAQTDALLAGAVEMVNAGLGNLLLLWDRTKGGVKGVVATQAIPLVLVSRNPKIKTLQDFGPQDRIAVPTVRVSTQAFLLQMACANAYGKEQWGKLDANTVQLGHPDAAVAMSNPHHEITSHFAAAPYFFRELKTVRGAHVVLSSQEVIGGPLTQSQFFTTTKFADANPKVIEAVRAATAEALGLIHKDTRAAVEIYREVTGDKTDVEELLELMKQPGMMDYSLEPQGTMKIARHLHDIGTLKTMPKSWKDYFLPIAHDLQGD
jgi:NitT/TauT family transport system substrate-binding protein